MYLETDEENFEEVDEQMAKFNIYYHVGFEEIEADNEEEAVKMAEHELDKLDLIASVDIDEVEEVNEQ